MLLYNKELLELGLQTEVSHSSSESIRIDFFDGVIPDQSLFQIEHASYMPDYPKRMTRANFDSLMNTLGIQDSRLLSLLIRGADDKQMLKTKPQQIFARLATNTTSTSLFLEGTATWFMMNISNAASTYVSSCYIGSVGLLDSGADLEVSTNIIDATFDPTVVRLAISYDIDTNMER